MKLEAAGFTMTVAYLDELHIRELRYSNGIVIVPDRGIDIFRGPDRHGTRYCRSCTILHFEMDAGTVCRDSNVAAAIAAEARDLLVEEASQDIIAIDAFAKEAKGTAFDNKGVQQIRHTLEGSKVKQWMDDCGFRFTADGKRIAKSDGYTCPFAYMASAGNNTTEEGLQRLLIQMD